MKKILKWGVLIGLTVVVLLVAAAVVAILTINKDMVAKQMEKSLNRKVTIGAIKVSIFSVVSGIDVENVRISNHKKPERIAEMKEVTDNDLFVSLKAFRFKLKFGSLLKKKFELTELTLYEPKAFIVRYPDGSLNISDLMQAKPKEETEKQPVEKKGPTKPLSADDLPVSIAIGKIGAEDGSLSFYDVRTGQNISVYGVTMLIHDIAINPKMLEKEDQVKITIRAGVKTVGTVRTESVKSFDITFAVDGIVKPFDLTTRLLNPEISLTAGSPKGMITGLQIFESMKNVQALEKYCGRLSFLKDELVWADAKVGIWYKENTVKLSDGIIKTDDGNISFNGAVNTASKAIDLNTGVILADKHKESIKKGVTDQVGKGIKSLKLDKYLKPEDVAETAMKYVLNEKGQIELVFEVKGTMSKPSTTLVTPKLPTSDELVKDASKSVQNLVKDAAQKEVDKQTDKLKKDATDKLKNLIK